MLALALLLLLVLFERLDQRHRNADGSPACAGLDVLRYRSPAVSLGTGTRTGSGAGIVLRTSVLSPHWLEQAADLQRAPGEVDVPPLQAERFTLA